MIESYTRIRMLDTDGITESASKPAELVDAIGYLDRTEDKNLLKQYTKNRYATGLKKANTTDDATIQEGNYDTYTLGKVNTAIEVGKFEIVPSGLYGRIVDEVATLFTQTDQKWIYSGDGIDAEEIEETVLEHRQAGRFGETVERWDRLSVGVNCSYLRLLWVSGHIQYEVIRPTAIHFQFPLQIEEDSEFRSPLYTEIEDAATVAIQLTQTSSGSKDVQWIAYVGRSNQYPLGRCVTYASNKPYPIPELGDGNIINEYTIGEEAANPLTYLQDFYGPDMVHYEYPVSRLLGTASGADERLIPTTDTLYQNSKELDSSSSRNLTAAVKASTGTTAIRDPMNRGLPETTEGAMSLRGEQEITWGGRDAIHAVNAGNVIDNQKRELAESYGVPGYRVVHTQTQPESGAALLIRHQPQVEYRKKRIRLNYANVIRLSELEIYYISMFGDIELKDVDITWFPGTWAPPVPPLDLIAEIKEAEANGYIDKVEAVRRYHRMETREEAREKLEEIQQTETDFGAVSSNNVTRAIAGLRAQRQQTPLSIPGQSAPETDEG